MRRGVEPGDLRTFAVVREMSAAPGCSSSWLVVHHVQERRKVGGRPKLDGFVWRGKKRR